MSLSYDEALSALDSALVFGTNPSLEGVAAMVHAMGDPQRSFATVQVAGTNGKTSTSRLTAALLAAHGMCTGLYTSPELERYPERIEVGGDVVSDSEFASAVEAAIAASDEVYPAGSRATEFELLTAGALWLFRERDVDFAVLEVGLGGRWDATSVVAPAVAVITGVDLDHTQILGDTREQIAAEKAAIIRPASAPVLGPGTAGVEQVFLDAAAAAATHARAVCESGEPSPVAEELTVRYRVVETPRDVRGSTIVDVRGVHADYAGLEIHAASLQAANVATAIAAAEAALGRALDPDAVRVAVAGVRIPGRFELVREEPVVVIDAAHNPEAAGKLAAAIAEAFGAEKPALLLGVLADKDARGIVERLAPAVSRIAVTRSASPRALEPAQLAEVVAAVSGEQPRVFGSVREALEVLLEEGGPLVISGSITVAGEARSILRA